MIGLSLLVVLMVSKPIVMTRMKSKSNKSSSSSSGDRFLLDLTHKERWDYINKKAEDIIKMEEEKISQIECKADEKII